MIQICVLALLLLPVQSPGSPDRPAPPAGAPEKSPFFAFVDREFIFTVEIVKPGTPLLNFVSMSDEENRLYAKDIRLTLEDRKAPAALLAIDTGDFQQPMSLTSIAVRPRSSFGVRLEGSFGKATELAGATIRMGSSEFTLSPLSSFDFENLALKVNNLNLGSPDFREDMRVLKLELLGARAPFRK